MPTSWPRNGLHTGVEVPFHPDRIEPGVIASLKVKLIVSPSSAFPAVPPALLVVWTSVPVGPVVSRVNVDVADVTLPALSVAYAFTVYEPSAGYADDASAYDQLVVPVAVPVSSGEPMSTQSLVAFPEPVFCTKIASRLTRTYTDRHGLKDICFELLGVGHR